MPTALSYVSARIARAHAPGSRGAAQVHRRAQHRRLGEVAFHGVCYVAGASSWQCNIRLPTRLYASMRGVPFACASDTARRLPHPRVPWHASSIQAARALIDALHEMEQWVEQIPPLQQPMRYGNKAYRAWHTKLLSEAAAMCERVVAGVAPGASVEVAPYLYESFGNATRIDYGTGHETAFIIFLRACCGRLVTCTLVGRQSSVATARTLS